MSSNYNVAQLKGTYRCWGMKDEKLMCEVVTVDGSAFSFSKHAALAVSHVT